jgi:hypothetical protein
MTYSDRMHSTNIKKINNTFGDECHSVNRVEYNRLTIPHMYTPIGQG